MDNVDIPGRCTDVVEQFFECGCRCNGAVWEVEYRGGCVPGVLLTADDMVPFNTPMRILCCAASGLM
jgi:hypothetical protein